MNLTLKRPLFRSRILKRIILASVLLSSAAGGFAAPPVAPDPAAGKARTEEETRAWVLEKLNVGVNTDFTFTGYTSPDKVHYEPAYLDAVAAAGFKSVRIFSGYSREGPAIFEKVIKDAIARDLAIVFINFGDMRGKDAFVKTWREITQGYRIRSRSNSPNRPRQLPNPIDYLGKSAIDYRGHAHTTTSIAALSISRRNT